jgi:hypothetical protein
MSAKIKRVLKKMLKVPFLVFSFVGGSLSLTQNVMDRTLN